MSVFQGLSKSSTRRKDPFSNCFHCWRNLYAKSFFMLYVEHNLKRRKNFTFHMALNFSSSQAQTEKGKFSLLILEIDYEVFFSFFAPAERQNSPRNISLTQKNSLHILLKNPKKSRRLGEERESPSGKTSKSVFAFTNCWSFNNETVLLHLNLLFHFNLQQNQTSRRNDNLKPNYSTRNSAFHCQIQTFQPKEN